MKFIHFQETKFIKDYLTISAEQSIRSDIAYLLETAGVEIITAKRDRVIVANGFTGNLAKDQIIPS